MTIDYGGWSNMGWECPRCHRCYSPSITMCSYCNGNKSYGTTTTGSPMPKLPTIWSFTTNGTTYTIKPGGGGAG